ncbi:MAG: hypothetical protein AAF694_22310 [Bacteroidota bacterium]
MSIPIKNMYYLLSYAWDRGKIAGWSKGVGNTGAGMSELLLCILEEALVNCQVLPRAYSFVSTQSIYPGIKGKVNLSQSLKKNLFTQGKAQVQFESLATDDLYLKILWSTWRKMEVKQHLPILPILSSFSGEYKGGLSPSLFAQAYRQYSQPQIRYLIRLCEWIYHKYLPIPGRRGISIQNFLLNSQEMPALFEAFIRNFYRRHATDYDFIGKEQLKWGNSQESENALLPRMETDVSLISPTRKIVVETKYYKEALQTHYRANSSKFHSNHLFQIFAYLSHAGVAKNGKPCEGLLIYPTVNFRLEESCFLAQHPIRVYTLDLNRPWEKVHAELLSWVA